MGMLRSSAAAPPGSAGFFGSMLGQRHGFAPERGPFSERLVTKRGDCRGCNAKISWTQVQTGSSITWKYRSCILLGRQGYSIAISNGYQQVDSDTKMIQLGKDTSAACQRCLALRLVDDAFMMN